MIGSAHNPSQNAASGHGDSVAATPGRAKLHVDLRELSNDEAVEMLSQHHVGHVGISFHDLVRLKLCN